VNAFFRPLLRRNAHGGLAFAIMVRESSHLERDQILALLRERIVHFAASRLSRDAAEDLAQEVLIVLHEKYPRVDRIEELLPLSLRIVRYKILGARRKMVRHGEYSQVSVDDLPLADSSDTEKETSRRLMVERLRKAMPKLGDRCRELLKYKLEGRSFAEIQAVMGAASINTIYTWDFRCRKHLLELMGGDWERE
jgi:RNA polymerase sigma-70 factor, ECF subfamily